MLKLAQKKIYSSLKIFLSEIIFPGSGFTDGCNEYISDRNIGTVKKHFIMGTSENIVFRDSLIIISVTAEIILLLQTPWPQFP